VSMIPLFEELSPTEAHIITETSKDGSKTPWLSGIFMQAGIKNRNGRQYPLSEISAAVSGAHQRIKESNGIFGELDHPQSLSINLDRISHVITELRLEGNNVYGKAKMLNTPMGNIAKELINSGVKVGVSSRGAGAVNESGDVSGYQFVTVDIVAQPSAPDAYPSTMYESLQTKMGGKIMTLAESAQHDPAAQKYLKAEIFNWIKQLNLKRTK
jgi:hypothetical protein